MSPVVEIAQVVLRTDEFGVMRVGNTRVRLDTVITAWKQGDSPEQIAENFDALELADVYAVISYYLHHRPEVDTYLAQNRAEGELLRVEMEKRFPQAGIRERLLARQQARAKKERAH